MPNKPMTTKEMSDWNEKTWNKCQEEAWAKPLALRLAALLDATHFSENAHPAAAELRRLQALIDACDIYLKAGETPAERIAREHADRLTLMELLAKEKQKTEALLEVLRHCSHINGFREFNDYLPTIRAAIKAAEENT